MEQHYIHHVLRMPAEQWPDPVKRGIGHINPAIYIPMQGPSELGLGGKLLDWDRTADLDQIDVPTLVIGAQHDTMDPAHMQWMAGAVPTAATYIAPTAATLPCTTTTRPTPMACRLHPRCRRGRFPRERCWQMTCLLHQFGAINRRIPGHLRSLAVACNNTRSRLPPSWDRSSIPNCRSCYSCNKPRQARTRRFRNIPLGCREGRASMLERSVR